MQQRILVVQPQQLLHLPSPTQLTVIRLPRPIAQKPSLARTVENGLHVPGTEENVSNSQDAHPMQKQLTQNVRLFQIDV